MPVISRVEGQCPSCGSARAAEALAGRRPRHRRAPHQPGKVPALCRCAASAGITARGEGGTAPTSIVPAGAGPRSGAAESRDLSRSRRLIPVVRDAIIILPSHLTEGCAREASRLCGVGCSSGVAGNATGRSGARLGRDGASPTRGESSEMPRVGQKSCAGAVGKPLKTKTNRGASPPRLPRLPPGGTPTIAPPKAKPCVERAAEHCSLMGETERDQSNGLNPAPPDDPAVRGHRPRRPGSAWPAARRRARWR